MFRRFDPTNIVMVYLVGIVAVSLRFGRGPSVLASILGVAAFDFFFVSPSFTFAVSDTEYVFTFAVMLATGLIISTLTLRVKAHAEAARQRERRTAALYEMSRELAALQKPEGILEAARRHVERRAARPSRLLVARRERSPQSRARWRVHGPKGGRAAMGV